MTGLEGEVLTSRAERMAGARLAPEGAGGPEGAHATAHSPERERLFAAAQRRSARVRFLRRAIFAFVAAAVAAMIAIVVFDPFGPKVGSLSFSNLSIDGTKIAMSKPRLAGFRSDGQPYVLTAQRALQDIKKPTIAELETLVGDIGTPTGETTRLTAELGRLRHRRPAHEHVRKRENLEFTLAGPIAQRGHRF